MNIPSLKGKLAHIQGDISCYCDFECQSNMCEHCSINAALRRLDSIMAFPNWDVPIAELLDVEDELMVTTESDPMLRVVKGGKE